MNNTRSKFIIGLLITAILITGFVDSVFTNRIAQASYIPGLTVTQSQIDTWNAKLSNIASTVGAGSHIQITGSGTTGSPYVIATTGEEPSVTGGSAQQFYAWDKTWKDLNKGMVGLGNVINIDTTIASNITVDATHRWWTDSLAATLSGKFTTPAGTLAQYIAGNGTLVTFPTIPTVNYKSYQSILTQSGGSAPSVTNGQNDFGSTTFTWTRLSAGTYRVTASTAVFTANKTVVVISDPASSLVQYTAVVNSTTTATISTNILSVLSLLLNATVTDSLLTNTLVDIRVYN